MSFRPLGLGGSSEYLAEFDDLVVFVAAGGQWFRGVEFCHNSAYGEDVHGGVVSEVS